MEQGGWASLCWPLPGILPFGIVGKALTSVPAVSCVPHPFKHQRSDHSVSTVSRVPHPLSRPHCVWRGLREGGKEIQRIIVRLGEGDGFRNCLVKILLAGKRVLPPPVGGWSGEGTRAQVLSTLCGEHLVYPAFLSSGSPPAQVILLQVLPSIPDAVLMATGVMPRQGALKARRLQPPARGSPTPHPPSLQPGAAARSQAGSPPPPPALTSHLQRKGGSQHLSCFLRSPDREVVGVQTRGRGHTQRACPWVPLSRAAHHPVLRNVRERGRKQLRLP